MTAAGQGVDSSLGPLALPPETGMLCLRPENIGPDGPLALGPARLIEASFFGAHHRCRFAPLAAPDTVLSVHLPADKLPATGAEVDLFAAHPVILPGQPA